MLFPRFLAALLISAGCAFAADIAGTWTLTFDTPNGKFEATVELKQDGEKLTGTLHNQFGDSDIAGTVKDKDISLAQKFERDGQSISIVYTGKLDSADKMSGKFKFGDQGEGDWSAAKK